MQTPIREKVRDKLYGSEADEAKNERRASFISRFTDSMDGPFAAGKRLIVSLAIEAIVVGSILVFPTQIYKYAGYWTNYVIFGVFALGFAISFAAAVLVNSRFINNEAERIDSGLMSGFAEQERRRRQFKIYLAATAGGFLNVIVLYVFLETWRMQ
jgi:hypothetical protein